MTSSQDETAAPGSAPVGRHRRAIVYMVWGEDYLAQACEAAQSARATGLPLVLITDQASTGFLRDDHPFTQVKVIEAFRSYDMRVKCTLYDLLPAEYDSFLFLDTDTHILGDITFGFEKAERFGIAVSPATSYCLPSHHDFRRILLAAGLPDAGQIQYNSGVIFFVRRPDVAEVFEVFKDAGYRLAEEFGYTNAGGRLVDQPFLSYAMEVLDFNPYTLSINYCYRGLSAEPRYGDVVIWHSHYPAPADVNDPAVPRMRRPRYFMGQPVDMDPALRPIREAQTGPARPRAMDDPPRGKKADRE